MIANEYFDNNEHYCFDKHDISNFFSHCWRHSNKFKCKMQNLANDGRLNPIQTGGGGNTRAKFNYS